ncbi:MAG: monovalent cation/H+ antiporter subunit D family protein [Rhodospirillaceae bacterium]|nr:monovalent cation/H+ antiporter subunit D family protein [Rhodospirillaceae bacterium]
MNAGLLVALAVLVPLAGAGLIALSGRWPNLRETITVFTAVLLFIVNILLAVLVLDGETPALHVAEPVEGVPFAFAIEPLGMLFGLVASFLWIVNSVYSIGYMRGNKEGHQTRFYVCFAVALASTMGLAFSANLFTLFVFYEALTLSTYPLVTHAGTEKAVRAGRVYLGILISTSIVFLLTAILIVWQQTGTLTFAPGGILQGRVSDALGLILLVLFMYGIGKAALMPIHPWLPAAMVAPTPVSALLHAVAVVKAGVFTVVKVIVYVFGLDYLQNLGGSEWLLYVSGATIIVASVIALQADNLKRRLAYSTVSQLSYVIMAAALFTPMAVAGAVLHIAAHAFGKITLFFAAGSIYTAAHKTEVSQLDGIGRRMPWTMAAFGIGALSMIGLPLTAGFVSKWYFLSGALDTRSVVTICVIFASTLLNAGYFLPIVYRAFFRPAPEGGPHDDHGEAPFPIVLALTVTAAGTIILFLMPQLPLALARAVVGG